MRVGNIRNFAAFYRSLPDWSKLTGCDEKGARPSDLDGVTDIEGNLLFKDQKEVGAEENGGQVLLWNNLLKLNDDPSRCKVHVLFTKTLEIGRQTCPLCEGAGEVPQYRKDLVSIKDIRTGRTFKRDWPGYRDWYTGWCWQSRNPAKDAA